MAGRVLVAAAAFVTAAVCVVVLALNTPAGRGLVVAETNRAIAGTFRGTLEITSVRHLDLRGADDVDLILRDPQGRVVATAEGVTVRISVLPVVWAALRGTGDIPIVVSVARVHRIRATLLADSDGEPTVLHAFEPRHREQPGESSRGVRIDVRSLRIEELQVSGQAASFDHLDARMNGLAASFRHDETNTEVDLTGLDLDVRGILPESVTAHVAGRAHLPSAGKREASASIEGKAGAIPVSLRAILMGNRVDATARVLAGGGPIEVGLVADMGEVTTGDLTVAVTGVDPHRIVPSAPRADVHARARAQVRVEPGGVVTGELTVHTDPTRVASQLVPALDARAGFTRTSMTGTVRLAEPGAPVDLRFEAKRERGATALDFDMHATAPELAYVPMLHAWGARGAAEVHAIGHVDLDSRAVDADVDFTAAGVHVGAQAVRSAVVRGHVEGPLEAISGRVAVEARGLEAEGRTLDSASGHAALTFVHGFTAYDAVLRTAVDRTTVTTRAGLVHGGDGQLDVVGLEIDGLGSPIHGEFHSRPRGVAVRVLAPDTNIPRLLRLFGKSAQGSGHLALDVDLRGSTGHLDGTLATTGLFGVERGDARIAMKLDDRRVDGTLAFAFDGARATATLRDLVLGGPLGEERAWRRATGAVDVSSSVNLGAVRKVLLNWTPAPIEQMGGIVSLTAHVARARPDGVPDATLDLRTQNLALRLRPSGPKPEAIPAHEPEEVGPPKPGFRTSGLDAHLAASLEGPSRRFTLKASLLDARGPILKVQAQATPPLAQLLREPRAATKVLERTPVQVHVELPPRELAELPPVLRPGALRGKLQATLDASGPMVDPRAEVHGRAVGVTLMQSGSALPFDGSLDATYDGRAAIARVLAERPEGVALDIRADVDAPIARLLVPDAGSRPWDAGATVALHSFPLEAIPQLASLGVAARVSGVVALEGLHRDARVEADIKLDKPRLGAVCFREGSVRLQIDRNRLIAATRIESPGSFAADTVNASSHWDADLTPTIDASQPVDATLEARDFRVAALQPFVAGAIDQLDGRLNGHVRVHSGPDPQNGQFEGDLALSDGIVEIPAFGEQLHGVGARVTIRPWGTLRIDDATASGPTGKLTGAALARFDGIRFRGATADVDIPRDQRMPATVEGVALGAVSGHVHMDASMAADDKTLDVRIDLPQAQLELPRSAGRAVQSLDPAPGVIVGTHEPSTGRFVVLPQHGPEKPRRADALTVRAAVRLGQDVRIRRGEDLDVELTGQPMLDITDKTQMSGTIHLTRGTVDVLGKRFTLEPSSTVAFSGDTSNPQLRVTAMYEAPDHTRIFADVLGTPDKLKANLRSEPPLKQDEILGLLLFGSPEGLGGTPGPGEQPDPTQQAAGLASGVVAQGINQALSGISKVEISTRLDTTQAANPRPEVDVRLSNNVLAHVTVQTGTPAPGEPPDLTLVTIDWRFKPRWSLRSTVGDQGSTLFDLLWRHRY
ncbi:MAG: translocation/assembly module TamB domain-containing protein [Polyangiaceae bacterium]